MSVFDKLFGRKPVTGSPVAPPPACPHTTLVPRWDSLADMGHDDKASGYTCQGCQQTFTAEQGRELLRTEAERVRRQLEI